MRAAFSQLSLFLGSNYYRGTNFGQCFVVARRQVDVICADFLDHGYHGFYIYAPKRYSTARADLDYGLQLLCASEQRFIDSPQVFTIIKAHAEECQTTMDGYAAAWKSIRAFDAENTLPYFQRKFYGRDAFSRKASMVDMLRDLRECV